MSMFRVFAASFAALAAIGATASLAQEPAPPVPAASPAPGAAAAPPAGFEDCAACHGVTKDAGPNIGPNLWGVGGRQAGAAPDYPFSPALKAHGVTWTPETLQPFIVSPMGTVPGTTMAYPGVSDPTAAKAIADYLMTLKD